MDKISKMIVSAMCLALCIVLPFLTGHIPQIGSALSPMHIPVLICGFACGGIYGAIIGFVAPLLRFALFGMPPIFPTGTAMAFELASYGILAGILYRVFPKTTRFIYITLISSMLGGRIIWGIAMKICMTSQGSAFAWSGFISGAFVKAVPGIICHIAIIPVIVIALRKAGLIHNE